MKRFNIRALPLSVALATGVAAVLSAPAHATDTLAPQGSSATGSGQIATTYYVAQPAGGWYTLLNLTNTSASAIAVKVRLKEFKNSREALDINVMLSPYDVWTASISQIGEEIYVRSTDKSCVAPYQAYETLTSGLPGADSGLALRTNAFYDGPDADYPAGLITSDDGGSTTIQEAIDRTKEGHIELIVMGECAKGGTDPTNGLPNTSAGNCFGPGVVPFPGQSPLDGIGYVTEHIAVGGDETDRQPRDCATAADYFLPDNTAALAAGGAITNPNGGPKAAGALADTANTIGYQGVTSSAPIKVNVAYVEVGEGSGASIEALHLDAVIPFGSNLITAQEYPWFLEPTIATAPSGQLWNMTELLNMEQQFTWTDTYNEWSVNPAANVKTSIVLNMPTKAYHVDQTCNDLFASNNRWRWNGAALLACATPNAVDSNLGLVNGRDYSAFVGTGNNDGTRNGLAFPPSLEPFTNRWANGASPVTLWLSVWDREEGFPPGGDVSPGGYEFELPWEVAQIVFEESGGALSAPDPTPSEYYIPAVDDLPSGATNGWANIALDYGNTFDAYGANQGVNFANQSFVGLPIQALLVKTRTLGAATGLYGQGTNNGFKYCQYGDTANGVVAPTGVIVDSPALPNTFATGWACQP